MAVTELNEDTQDQICELLENLQQVEKLENNFTLCYSYFTKFAL